MPMRATSVWFVTLGHARDAPRELAEVRGHVAELLCSTLELAKRGRLLACAPRDLLRAVAIASRYAADARHPLAELGEFQLLFARRESDALRAGGRALRRVDDQVERLACLLG